jgi:hypothetical protein
MEVFRGLDPEAPLIVAECVWQYSHHVLAGLFTHRGPILTVANWSGMWPGLVGMLNLNGSMTKAGIPVFSTLWSEDFGEAVFPRRAAAVAGHGAGDARHRVTCGIWRYLKLPAADEALGRAGGGVPRSARRSWACSTKGCMGMFNAIIPDELLHPTGVFKERLSQSTHCTPRCRR